MTGRNEEDHVRRIRRGANGARTAVWLALATGILWLLLRSSICWDPDMPDDWHPFACRVAVSVPLSVYVALTGTSAFVLMALAGFGRYLAEVDPAEGMNREQWMRGKPAFRRHAHHARRGYRRLPEPHRKVVRSAARWASTAVGILTGTVSWYRFEVAPVIGALIGLVTSFGLLRIARSISRDPKTYSSNETQKPSSPAPAPA